MGTRLGRTGALFRAEGTERRGSSPAGAYEKCREERKIGVQFAPETAKFSSLILTAGNRPATGDHRKAYLDGV
jgi:hypothetical protein